MEKVSRPQRQRRHSRRPWPPEEDVYTPPRPTKRLFTTEIKCMLKNWLVRRRENPYPNREEKKRLALETGLTYTQICNWFANWRRKLKNSERERERVRKSWGHLIKNYNTNAKGNVEQFSISSEDSIWEEEEHDDHITYDLKQFPDNSIDDAKSPRNAMDIELNTSTQITSAMKTCESPQHSPLALIDSPNMSNGHSPSPNLCSTTKPKYKQKIIEKYLRDTQEQQQEAQSQVYPVNSSSSSAEGVTTDGSLTKWLESAARFTPEKQNYFIEWNHKRHSPVRKSYAKLPGRITVISRSRNKGCSPQREAPESPQKSPTHLYETIHQKDELDAAEALANLAFNCRQRQHLVENPVQASA